MSRRIRVHDESLNSYGFWLKTSGGDLSDFKKNPVCLWNHHQSWRGTNEEVLPIGRWEDLSVSGEEISATPKFDLEDDFAAKIAKKYENGFLNAASIGVQILEWSEDPEMMKSGQTRPTVTKWRLREISIVDIPANKNAVCFYDQEGNIVNLSEKEAETNLDKIGLKLKAQTDTSKMNELQTVALQLGLPATATLADVQKTISGLTDLRTENVALKDREKNLSAQLKDFQDKQAEARKVEIKTLLDTAVTDNKITAAQRPVYEKLFDADFESTKALVDGLPKVVKLSEVPAAQQGAGQMTYQGKTFSQLRRESPDLLATLKANDFNTFNELYKAEYGKPYKVDAAD